MGKAEKPQVSLAQKGKKGISTLEELNFTAVDVETANSDVSSICQVGIAVVRSSRITHVWTQLVDPRDFFDPYNTAVHGIDYDMVRGSPRFYEICERISEYLRETVVSHTFFDQRALSKAFTQCGKPLRWETWVDSAQVARRAWPEKYALRGYSLANIASDLGIRFRHHDAGEDARAAAQIVLKAYKETPSGINPLLNADT
ncbi:MAG: 3'-5' exonuclease [Candidatus Dadabacteria bacterium]|nr:3'-5' exonuclease [Candidatus Dadabacteria bacterium]